MVETFHNRGPRGLQRDGIGCQFWAQTWFWARFRSSGLVSLAPPFKRDMARVENRTAHLMTHDSGALGLSCILLLTVTGLIAWKASALICRSVWDITTGMATNSRAKRRGALTIIKPHQGLSKRSEHPTCKSIKDTKYTEH